MTDDRPPIVAAIVVHDRRVALVRRRISEGTLSWQFPAGQQEPGETPFQTAAREVAEEIGLLVTPTALIGQRQHPATGRHMIYIACATDTDNASLVDTDELAELAWSSKDDLDHKIPSGLFEPVAAYLDHHL